MTASAAIDAELDIVLAAAGRAAGHTPLVALPGGRDNRLYATAAGGRELVVKVPRTSRRVRYAVAAWVAARLADTGIPAPIVLGYSDRLSVETRCPGSPLDDPDRPPHISNHDLAAAAGRLLRRIHALPVGGFGRLDAHGVGLRPTLQSWLPQLPPLPPTAPPDLHALRAQVQQVLRHHAPRLPASPARLLHGDWTARHIITNDAAITGVVDLESVRGGDPLADLAGWSLQEPAPHTAGLLAGYFDQPPDQAARTVLVIYRLRIAACLLVHHVTDNDVAGVALRTAQLHADLADLSCGQPAATPRISPEPPATPMR